MLIETHICMYLLQYTTFNNAKQLRNAINNAKLYMFAMQQCTQMKITLFLHQYCFFFLKNVSYIHDHTLKNMSKNFTMICWIVYAWKKNKHQTHFHIYNIQAYTRSFAPLMSLNECQWPFKNKWDNVIQIRLRHWRYALYILHQSTKK